MIYWPQNTYVCILSSYKTWLSCSFDIKCYPKGKNVQFFIKSVFLYIKCGWSISLEHFVERKPLISEECNSYSTRYVCHKHSQRQLEDASSCLHSSKFSKRNYNFPLHSQKLGTYFVQISPNSTLHPQTRRTCLTLNNSWFLENVFFLVWREIQIRK